MLTKILKLSFLLLVFSLPFIQPFNFNFSGLVVQISDFIFLFVSFVFILAFLLKKIKFIFHRFYWLLAFYLFAFFLSAIFSETPKQSFFKLFGEVYLIGLCILTFNVVRSTEMFKKTAFVWLAATSLVSLLGTLTVILFYIAPQNFLLSYTLHHYGTLIPGNYPRLQVSFYYPAMLCHYLSISLLILFVSYKNQWINRTIFLLILFTISIILFFTLTPGLGGVCLSIGLWLWLNFKEKSNFRLARFSLTGGILLSLAFFLITLVSPIQTETSPYFITIPTIEKRIDPSVRLLAWQSALETFYQNPIFGKGVGADVANVIYRDASLRTQNLRDAHQLWISVAAQEGIFGLAAILWITFYLWRNIFPFELDGKPETVLRIGLATAFLSAFVYQGLIGSFEDARHLWVLFGLILFSNELK